MALRCPSELPAFGARLSRDVRIYVTNQCLKNYTVLGAKASWCHSKSRRRTSITPLTRA